MTTSSKKQIRRIRGHRGARCRRRIRLQHPVAAFECTPQTVARRGLIIDDENRFHGWVSFAANGIVTRKRLPRLSPTGLSISSLPAEFFQAAGDDGEAEACAAGLGGKEGLKYFFAEGRGKAWAVVFHGDGASVRFTVEA